MRAQGRVDEWVQSKGQGGGVEVLVVYSDSSIGEREHIIIRTSLRAK